jgi:hypothetical protein
MKGKSTSNSFVTLKWLLSSCFVLASGALALAQSEPSDNRERHAVCSDRTLSGHYGAKIEGTLLDFPGQPLLRSLVLFALKGDGTMTTKAYPVLNGQPENADWGDSLAGTYTINPDCTGSAETPPIKFHLIVVDQGRKFLLVLDGGATVGVAEKVH